MSVLGVDDLVGLPFVVGGRSRAGMDCLGLVLAGLQRLGFDWPDPWLSIQGAWERGERPISACVPDGWKEVPVSEPLRRGDVLVTGDRSQHIALALGAGWVLHTTATTGSHLARERALRGKLRFLFRRVAP